MKRFYGPNSRKRIRSWQDQRMMWEMATVVEPSHMVNSVTQEGVDTCKKDLTGAMADIDMESGIPTVHLGAVATELKAGLTYYIVPKRGGAMYRGVLMRRNARNWRLKETEHTFKQMMWPSGPAPKKYNQATFDTEHYDFYEMA